MDSLRRSKVLSLALWRATPQPPARQQRQPTETSLLEFHGSRSSLLCPSWRQHRGKTANGKTAFQITMAAINRSSPLLTRVLKATGLSTPLLMKADRVSVLKFRIHSSVDR